MNETRTNDHWWEGKRGEWYVAVQGVLLLLLFFGPRCTEEIPAWPERFQTLAYSVGGVLAAFGFVFGVAAALVLGRNLTPLPRPKEASQLVVKGPYRLVRHPIYTGVIFMAYGWSVLSQSWLTMGYATIVFLFLDVKSRREERWLVEKYPGYEAYRKAVKRLVPFIY